MIEAKEETGLWVDAIYEITAAMDRGQVLTHHQIREVLGVEPHTGPWGHVMNKVRRRLERERGIATWPEREVGYKLCTDAEQLALPVVRAKRGLRQIKRGRRSVEALPEQGLTVNQRRARLFLSERMREAEKSVRREIRSQTDQIRPTPTLPRRPANI